MTQFTIILVVHILLCIYALRQIWHGEDGDNAPWRVVWTILCLVGVLVGPIMCLGIAMPPSMKPKEGRSPDYIPPPSKPPSGGDTYAPSPQNPTADKNDLAREIEEARALEQQEIKRQREQEREI